MTQIRYEKDADLSLIRALLNGDWDERFLVVEPGRRVVARYDESIFTTERCNTE